MPEYSAPLRDMRFAITELADLAGVMRLPGFEDTSAELVDAVLEEAAKLAEDVLSPLNRTGDRAGATLGSAGVVAPAGFGDAYHRFVENGWCALNGDPLYGGQGLPALVAAATSEMWNSANMAFALCPLLASGAMEAIRAHASAPLKATYLPHLISGQWTGTMNLTEPQAGSDLSALRTRAVPEGEHFRILGQKIYITWGDHDMTPNVVHLVLARLPEAPEGTRGISLFLVPKFLVNANGSLGARNDVKCTSLEHKLGIHGSPTCVMSFGEEGGAFGYLVGEVNCGLANMFTMMNEARQKVGLQGLAIAERAYQAARAFAKERVQGRPVGQKAQGIKAQGIKAQGIKAQGIKAQGIKAGVRVPIIHHPDVRRMLLTMKSQIEAMRGLAYVMAADIDIAHRHPSPAERQLRQARVDLLTPVLKGWCTELGVEIASLGVQVHGGMGFIEETGAAQYLRDARIAPIYEGTNGIQAADLVGRKLPAQQGAAMAELVAEMRRALAIIDRVDGATFASISQHFSVAVSALEQSSEWLRRTLAHNPQAALASSYHYMMLTGYVCGGWQLARAAVRAQAALDATPGDGFMQAKITTAAFYAEQILPKATSLLTTICAGASHADALALEQF